MEFNFFNILHQPIFLRSLDFGINFNSLNILKISSLRKFETNNLLFLQTIFFFDSLRNYLGRQYIIEKQVQKLKAALCFNYNKVLFIKRHRLCL